ncbi:MAG: hypothetical protein QNL62_25595 [Gammaproteobacteria bacterium]|nr:hypothetical protein [Gammaproteobacteria bacterium]
MNAKLILGVIAMLLSLNACAAAPTSHFSVQVHEENGGPIEGVMVQGGFSTLMRDYVPGPNVKAITDKDGKAEISGPAYFSVYVDAIKEGYYKSGRKIPVNQEKDQSISILLRSKKNPIAMYAKKELVNASDTRKSGEQFGYDFMAGDFVSPHGNGKVSDLLITHTYNKKDTWNYSYKTSIDFSNPDDGLIPFFIDKKFKDSDFKSNYNAPEKGYLNNWIVQGSREGKGKSVQGNKDKSRNYFFRVRTKTDKEGNVESAYYGKIYGEFLSITYYLNPAINDRNVEFDSRQNLLKNLKHLEEVGAP